MTVKQIVEKYLRDNGYDGLVGNQCGCLLEDLEPCGEMSSDCQAAYRHNCRPNECKEVGCNLMGMDGVFCMKTVKP